VSAPVPVAEPLVDLELPWLPMSLPVLGVLLKVLLELLPLLGCSLVVPAPPCSLLQPTKAKAAQTMRINFFIVSFSCVSVWFLGSVFSLAGTIGYRRLPDNTVKPCFQSGKAPKRPRNRPFSGAWPRGHGF